MRRSILLTSQAFDEGALASSRPVSATAGAVVSFCGCVREMEGNRKLEAIEYEAFPAMVYRQFERLLDEAERRWPLESVDIVHRTGRVSPGVASVWIRVVSPHRAEALESCGWILEEMKRVVPIWKKPIWAASSR